MCSYCPGTKAEAALYETSGAAALNVPEGWAMSQVLDS